MTEELVTVATFPTLIRAQEVKLWLEAEDIPVFIADAEFVNMEWAMGLAVGGAKVQVPKSRQDDAERVLKEMFAVHERAAGRPETDTCLQCGTALPKDKDRCAACGWTYAAPGDG